MTNEVRRPFPRKLRSASLLTWTLLALAACTGPQGDGQGGSTSDGQNGGGDDVKEGDLVAVLQCEAPAVSSFLLHGTVPLPRGVWDPRQSTKTPLRVVDENQRTYITQCEPVSLYPSPTDGVAVAEVTAHVQVPAGTSVGTPLSFPVAWMPFDEGTMTIQEDVRDLLGTPGSLRLVTHDVFGHTYETDLFEAVIDDQTPDHKTRTGQVVNGYRTHGVMLPTSPEGGSQGTLPHMMGVHAYVTTYHKQGFFSLDLHVHNGMDGLDKTTGDDDALLEVYFDQLDLVLPEQWQARTFQSSPSEGMPTIASDGRHLPLIAAQSDGSLHFMPRQSRFVRRLVVFRDQDRDAALAHLNHQTLGFCTEGTRADGTPLWSWWNPATARFLGQAKRLPDLSFLGLDNLRSQLVTEYTNRSAQVASGSSANYPLSSPALGWAQPWGVAYGGMTGGDEINIFDGLRTTATACQAGYALSLLTARCYMDRQPTALFDLQGRPTQVEDILVQTGSGEPYANGTFYITPSSSADPYGFNDAPTYQTTAVKAAGLEPAYADNLDSWMPIDVQHYIRYTRNLKTLSFVGNDPLAKDQLIAAAEIFRLGFHEYRNSANGYTQGTGLRTKMDYVVSYPGQGVDFQRSEGWGTDVGVCAYALGDAELRTRLYPWFERIAQTVRAGQSTCTGNIMATYIGKTLGGKAYIRMVGHSSYGDNALQGMRNSVFEGRDDSLTEQLEQMIVGNAYAQVSTGFWDNDNDQPYAYVGVGEVGQLGEYCHNIPEWAQSSYSKQSYYSSLAYAYEYTQDPLFLFRAAQMLGGGNLLSLLQAQGEYQLELSAGMLAMLQELPGA